MTPQGHGFGLGSSNFEQVVVVRHGGKDKRRCGVIRGTETRELGPELVPSAERRRDIVQTIQFVVDRRSGVEAKSKVDEIAPH